MSPTHEAGWSYLCVTCSDVVIFKHISFAFLRRLKKKDEKTKSLVSCSMCQVFIKYILLTRAKLTLERYVQFVGDTRADLLYCQIRVEMFYFLLVF